MKSYFKAFFGEKAFVLRNHMRRPTLVTRHAQYVHTILLIVPLLPPWAASLKAQ